MIEGASKGTNAIGMVMLLVFSSAAQAQMSHPGHQGPSRAHEIQIGNPTIGKRVFREKGCAQCHAIRGEGGTVGPDLGKIQHTHNVYAMAAIMWNHSPRMAQLMQEHGIKRPEFKGDEMAHLLAYLHSLDVVGDPARGQALFVSKGCVRCHAIRGEGGTVGPDLGASRHPHPPVELVGMMWNHSPAMTAIMRGLGMERPLFEGNEMADLLAYLRQVQGGHRGDAAQRGGHHVH